MKKGRTYLRGTGAEQIKRAEELVEKEFGSVDAVIESDPEIKGMRDAASAKPANATLPSKPRRAPRSRKLRRAV